MPDQYEIHRVQHKFTASSFATNVCFPVSKQRSAKMPGTLERKMERQQERRDGQRFAKIMAHPVVKTALAAEARVIRALQHRLEVAIQRGNRHMNAAAKAKNAQMIAEVERGKAKCKAKAMQQELDEARSQAAAEGRAKRKAEAELERVNQHSAGQDGWGHGGVLGNSGAARGAQQPQAWAARRSRKAGSRE